MLKKPYFIHVTSGKHVWRFNRSYRQRIGAYFEDENPGAQTMPLAWYSVLDPSDGE